MIDRSAEFERLFDAVVNRENIQLVADPGMGKSYIIDKLIDKLSGRRFCFEINLRGIRSSHELLYKLVQNINDAAEDSYNLKYQLKRILDERPMPLRVEEDNFQSWIKDLLVGLQNVSLDFLFIFEDVDQWESKDNLTEALHHFNGARNSQALISSMSSKKDLKNYSVIQLEAITTAQLMLSESSNYQHQDLEDLVQLSGGNTSFLIEIMNNMNGSSPRKAVKRVLESYHPIFYNFRNRFTALQWKLLLAIACEGYVSHPHAFDFLVNYRLGAASSVERALRNLSDSHIIVQTDMGWKVSNIRFRQWLVNLYPQVESLVQS